MVVGLCTGAYGIRLRGVGTARCCVDSRIVFNDLSLGGHITHIEYLVPVSVDHDAFPALILWDTITRGAEVEDLG